MGRFLLIWEEDMSRTPTNQEEKGKLYSKLIQATKSDLENGVKDWGLCVGNNMGYAIFEGSESELGPVIQKYTPYIRFKTFPVLDIDAVEDMLKQMEMAAQV